MSARPVTADADPTSSRAGKGGPRTPEGRARSSMNALKHGLRAERFVLLPDESREDFDALLAELSADLRPVGWIEVELVGKIAACLWKEMRGDRMEAETLAYLGGGKGPWTLGYAMGREVAGEHEMTRVVRYQGYVSAQLGRAMHALRARQAERRALAEAGLAPPAEPAPAPEPAPETKPAHEPEPEPKAASAPAAIPLEPEPESERTRPADKPAAGEPPTDLAEAVAAELDALITGGVLPARGVEALLALAEESGVLPAVEAAPGAPEPGRASGRRPSPTRPRAA